MSRTRVNATRRRLPVAQRRDEIVAAAQRLFGTRPTEDVTIEAIAAAAGASRALVYRYFGGKQQLYLHALLAAVDDLARVIEPPPGPPLSRLRFAVSGYLDFAERHAHGYVALVRGATHSAEAAEIVDRTRELIAELAFEGLELDRSQPRPRLLLVGWVAAAEAMTLHWLEHREIARDDLAKLLIENLLAVLPLPDQG
ncbi:TetR/AcrR family transcriptional regulator, partial [Allokutzneria albata]|uniref:DNA-binding transcriptional regulator, AcrR family n=1 Tax=Allokutzneria albata TaxID=211114 RepID=A0A1H0DQ17_ALLAB